MKNKDLKRQLFVILIFGMVGLLIQQIAFAHPLSEPPESGIIIQGERGRETIHATQSLTDIERYDQTNPDTPTLDQPPFMSVPENTLDGESFVPSIDAPSAILAASPSPASSFVALEDNISYIPPDTHGAAGPNHLMTTLNSQVRIQNRSGTNLSTVSLSSFWSSVNGGGGTFDPKVLYDPYNGRWIAVACDDSWAATSAVLLAVSANSDPTGTWHFFRIQLNDGDNWIDYPSLGFNKNWIVVSVNIFSSGGSFVRTNVYAFNKATTYAGSSAPYTLMTTLSDVFTLVPAITYDNSLDTEYLVSWYSSSSGIIRMARITGAVGVETLTLDSTNITSPLGGWSGVPPSGNDFAPQLGSTYKIQVNDHRMQNMVYRNGYLWTTHTIFLPSGTPTRSSVQWWQINPSGYGVVQNGRIDDPSGNFYAFPSIAVNQNDDVLIGFSRSSSSQYASGDYAFRSSDDPLNTMRTDVVLKAGEAPYYKTYSGTRNRWGDYSNTVVDPVNDTDFWTIQEYAWTNNGTYDRWSTWWGRIVPPPAAFDKSSPSNGATGQSTSPTLSWDSSDGASSYEYCYDTSNNNTCDGSWTSTGANTSVALSGLNGSTTYYWHVRAINTYGTTYSNGDTWWSFTPQALPGAFNKISPANNAIDQSTSITLTWGTSSGATSYEYCIDSVNDSSCTSPFAWTDVGNTTQVSLSGLDFSMAYYWQVRAKNIGGTTEASGGWWKFTTMVPKMIYIPLVMR